MAIYSLINYLRQVESEFAPYLASGDVKGLKRLLHRLNMRAKKDVKFNINDVFTSFYTLRDKSELGTIADRMLKDFTRLASKVEDNIVFEIRTGQQKEKTYEEIKQAVKGRLNGAESLARTLTGTGLGAVSAAKMMGDSLEAGAGKFKLVGPPPERRWCQEHLGLTFTIEQIRAMDNGQGLPVEFYRGGYNCRHEWAAVFDKL